MTGSDTIREGDSLTEITRAPDPVDLFQFSAAIWLTHRIHYDSEYTTSVENHPSLLVHGPLQAVYLTQAVRQELERRRPSCRVEVTHYTFRSIAPAYVNEKLTCRGRVVSVDEDRVRCEVWTEVDGRVTTRGEIEVVLVDHSRRSVVPT